MGSTFRLDQTNLKELIRERAEYSQIVTIRAITVPDMNKTSNPFWGRVLKDKKVNGVINWNYGSSVNRQRVREDKEPDFVPKPRRWGQRITESPFVEHNGKIYIELKGERTLEEIYRDIVTREPMPDQDAVRKYVKNPWNPAEHQGVDKGIYLRDYTLTNIYEIRIGGDLFIIKEPTFNENLQLQNQPES